MRIRSDSVIFGLPNPVLFSSYPDPTCNNGFIKLFSSWTKYKPEITKLSLKWWFIGSTFMPSYLKYKYIFLHFDLRSEAGVSSWAGSGSMEKMSDPHPWIKGFFFFFYKIPSYSNKVYTYLPNNLNQLLLQ